MKIAMTGASGFLGRALLPPLAARFPEARIELLVLPVDTLRDGLQRNLPAAASIVEGDVTSAHDVERLVSGSTFVIHLAGLISYWMPDRKRLEEVNVGGVRNVVEACVAHRVKRLLHVSSVGAIGYLADAALAEEGTPFNWPDSLPYMTSKRAGQAIVEEAVREGKLDAVIVNPASIMGPGDPDPSTPHNRLYSMFRAPGPAFSFSGGLAIVDVRDLCAIMLAALERGCAGERYLAVGCNVPYLDVVRAISRWHGNDRRPVPLPGALVSAAGWLLELMSLLSRKRPPLTAGYGRLSSLKAYYSNQKSRLAFGHEYLPFLTTIDDGCRFHSEHFGS